MSQVGQRVGPFEIVEPLSLPLPGSWYRAHRAGITTQQPAEVLVLLVDEDASEERAAARKIFERLKSLAHPRIPTAVAWYEGTSALALAGDPGIPLSRVVTACAQQGIRVNQATLLDVAIDLVDVVQHAHHRGRHHGWLADYLITLGTNGEMVVWGYGLGPAAVPADRWMAPERARALDDVSGATDQWGLAAILGALMTGQVPWSEEDPSMDARRGDMSHVLRPVNDEWPAMGRLLGRMLAPSPADRFPSIHPVREALLGLSRRVEGVSARVALLDRVLSPKRVTPTAVPEDMESFTAESETPPMRVEPPVPKIPSEEMPVVAPEIEGDLPVASVAGLDDSPTGSVVPPVFAPAVANQGGGVDVAMMSEDDKDTDVGHPEPEVATDEGDFTESVASEIDEVFPTELDAPKGGPTAVPADVEPVVPEPRRLSDDLPNEPEVPSQLPEDERSEPQLGDVRIDGPNLQPAPVVEDSLDIRVIAPWLVVAMLVLAALYTVL